MKRATGADDPALDETTWPMPEINLGVLGIEWQLRYGDPVSVRLQSAEIVAAYYALITDGTTEQQLKRLVALRRVHRRLTR